MIKKIVAYVILIGGIAAGIYFGFWCMLVQSILSACSAYDAGTLTATIVGWTVIKVILSSTVTAIIIFVSALISAFIGALGE